MTCLPDRCPTGTRAVRGCLGHVTTCRDAAGDGERRRGPPPPPRRRARGVGPLPAAWRGGPGPAACCNPFLPLSCHSLPFHAACCVLCLAVPCHVLCTLCALCAGARARVRCDRVLDLAAEAAGCPATHPPPSLPCCVLCCMLCCALPSCAVHALCRSASTCPPRPSRPPGCG